MTEHANLPVEQLHQDLRVKQPVRTASTANITLATPGAAIDGVTLTSGDRVLLKNQTAGAENGIYVWTGASTVLTRATDADSAADFVLGFLVYASEGTTNAGKFWTFTTSGAITLGATTLTFTPFGSGAGSVTSVAMTVPTSEFTVAGSPITGSGTLAVTKANVASNLIAAGPTSGAAAAWSFRALVAADLPVMGASGASHAAGAAPDPGASTGTARYLREDATWQVPPGSGGGGGGGGGTSSGGGGSGALVPIAVVGPILATQGTITFSSIPSTGFRNLWIRLSGRGTAASGGLANAVDIGVQFNTDTSANYDWANGITYSGGAVGYGGNAATAGYFGKIPGGGGASAGADGELSIYIGGYNTTTFNKSASATGAFKLATAASNQYSVTGAGHWRSSAAITSITLIPVSGSFDVGSYACLYGEMDSAGVLLTPASNLLFETTLTAASATIDTGTLSQAYRDLQVIINVRGDNASAQDLLIRYNGDSGNNYNYGSWGTTTSSSTNQSAIHTLLTVPGTGSTTGLFSAGIATIPDYTGTTIQKDCVTLAGAIGSNVPTMNHGVWHPASPAAITSIQILPAAGNFIAGTTLRVYGLPVSSGGGAAGTGTRLRLSANQSITTATATAIAWDTEDADADNQHYASAANLTGTVSKSAGSQTVTGSSTAFLTELSIGQVISVPGTAAEKRVVIAIASNTSLTVNSGFANTASGQTAARVNTAVVFRQPGFYTLETNIYSAALSTGAVTLAYYLNSLTTATSGTAIAQRDPVAINASAGYDLVCQRPFQQWDFVEVVWTQNSGGSVNVTADERTHFSVSARPTVIVAVPYVNLQDRKASGTGGGTFTSAGDRTRDLNTIVADSGGICTLASNQFTLPAGTYRIDAVAPSFNVQENRAWLYNVTDSVEVLPGQSNYGLNGLTSWARVTGRFYISAAKTFEIRHRCANTVSTNGFGVSVGGVFTVPTEVFTTVEIWKEG